MVSFHQVVTHVSVFHECLPGRLGLSKIGAIPALINTNLRKDSLLHSVTVANCKSIVFGTELADG